MPDQRCTADSSTCETCGVVDNLHEGLNSCMHVDCGHWDYNHWGVEHQYEHATCIVCAKADYEGAGEHEFEWHPYVPRHCNAAMDNTSPCAYVWAEGIGTVCEDKRGGCGQDPCPYIPSRCERGHVQEEVR